MKTANMRMGFIGAGTVGTALARVFSSKGYPVVAVHDLNSRSSQRFVRAVPRAQIVWNPQAVADAADIVFITTPDRAIAGVAASVAWHCGQAVVHCSGADSALLLEPATHMGAQTGVFHPLQSFASIEQAAAELPSATISVEARGALLKRLRKLAADAGGHCVVLNPEDKVLYHAAAVFASNYVVTMAWLASDLLRTAGISEVEATAALASLMRGTVNNVERLGFPGCLTGPIARGDVGTVAKHIAELERRAPGVLPAYRELARQTVPVALAKGGIDKEKARVLVDLLS